MVDRDEEFIQLRQQADALTAEFNILKHDHEAGYIPYVEALARNKAIAHDMWVVTNRMHTLIPRERHRPTRDAG